MSTKPKGKPNPRRAELSALSAQVRPLVKAGMYENVNAAIVAMYQQETGQTDFRTFNDWRKAGQPVRKGERGFPVWATPRERKGGEQAGGDLAMLAALSGVEPSGPQWFPVAYLFHAGQVDWPAFVAVTPKAQAGNVRAVMALVYALPLSIACALAPLYAALLVNAPVTDDAAQCATDSDCLAYCPPPADMPDCDGGPDDATDARGNYGTQP